MDKPIPETVAILEALQERWCVSTSGKDGARRIATFDTARGIRGEDDFDNEVFATRRCASDLAVAIERIRALTAAQQRGARGVVDELVARIKQVHELGYSDRAFRIRVLRAVEDLTGERNG